MLNDPLSFACCRNDEIRSVGLLLFHNFFRRDGDNAYLLAEIEESSSDHITHTRALLPTPN